MKMNRESSETVLKVAPVVPVTHDMRQEKLYDLQADSPTPETIGGREGGMHAGIVIGVLVGLRDSGIPLVDFPLNAGNKCVPARSLVPLTKGEMGREVALMFEGGDTQKPIVMGLIQHAGEVRGGIAELDSGEKPNSITLEVDGERFVFTAEKEIIFRCGKASITLTHAGKILISGAYLLSRSSGVNRIKGGSVQIN